MKNIFFALLVIIGISMLGCESGPKSGFGLRLPDGDLAQGEATFMALGCPACHTVAGVELPTPENVADFRLELGGMVYKVETYGELVTSIIHPSHRLSKRIPEEIIPADGASPMRNFNDIMTVEQLVDLVAFLQSSYELQLPEFEYYY